MTPGSCQYCGCTEDAACEGGCAWVDASRTVCSTCELGHKVATVPLAMLAHFHPAADLWVSGWGDRPLEERTALVMAGRSLIEGLGQHPSEEVVELVTALEQRYPREVATAREHRQSLVDLVTGILDGPRVVLAGQLP